MEKEKKALEEKKKEPKKPEFYSEAQLNEMRILFGTPESEIQEIIKRQNAQIEEQKRALEKEVEI